jgi:hypothetical protein
MNREAQGIIIGLVVIAAILFFSSTRQTVVGTWTLSTITVEINSKDGKEGVDETERSPFTDLPLSDHSLSLNEDNSFDEMWVTDRGDTTKMGGTWELTGDEIIVHQTMKNGFEDIEENSYDIKVAPTGNMLTWSVVGDFDDDNEEDDVIRYVTYRNK